jgi:hypothetical protein
MLRRPEPACRSLPTKTGGDAMETTYIVDHTHVGSVLDPANGWIISVSMTKGPSRYDAAVQTRDRSAWASGAFSVRGANDVALIGGNTICIDQNNGVKRFTNLSIGYKGGLKICSVPFGSQWELILSDIPVTRTEAA